MTIYVTYNNVTNNLIDIALTQPQVEDSTFTVRSYALDLSDLINRMWDKTTHTFIYKPDILRSCTVHEFMNRFTAQERIAIRLASEAQTEIGMALADYFDVLKVSTYVDLDSQELFGGLNFLVYMGLIDISRVAQILET